MVTLIVAVLAAVVISAFCSLSEAALYSVPWSWIERLRKDGRASGELLFSLRSNVEKPITAILTLNTIANTAGAAIAGAAGAAVFGAEDLWLFTAIFTVLILAFGEILPKTMGVAYSRPISMCIARPMMVLILALLPIILAGGLLARLVAGKKKDPLSSEEDPAGRGSA
jgi:CBS domain containing-hemolysin-like protein